MFVRKKKNRTGTFSVVVVDKSRGRFKEIKNFGVVSSDSEADALCANAQCAPYPDAQRTLAFIFFPRACSKPKNYDFHATKITLYHDNLTQTAEYLQQYTSHLQMTTYIGIRDL